MAMLTATPQRARRHFGPTLIVAVWTMLAVLPVVPLVIWSGAFAWRWPDLLPAEWSGRA